MLPVHNGLYCIIPPHMLDEIQSQGTPAQREKATRMAELSNQIRQERTAVFGQIAGEVVTATGAGLHRNIYDAGTGSNLPGNRVRTEGEPPTGDPAVDEAYDGSGETHSLFQDEFGRNSIDGLGLELDSTVHYQIGYDNAFWNGRQMVYGDGDEDLAESERIFNRFTNSIDIIGHELAHGVTEYEARLVYRNQSGALNESFSDVFGSLVKQRARGESASQADWIIGAGLFTSNVNVDGLRSMKAPGTAYSHPAIGQDIQPAHMRDYNQMTADNGGVHINSGIPNHAFYLAAREIGGNAWEKAGRIWYVALRDRLRANSGFQEAADQTFSVAGDDYGSGSLEQQAVRKAWADVGIDVSIQPPPSPPTNKRGRIGCLLPLMAIPITVATWLAYRASRGKS